MPLNPAVLGSALSAAIGGLSVGDKEDLDVIYETIATEVLNHIIANGIITIPTGAVVVATAGSAAAQTGSNTAPAIGTIM